MADTKEDKKEKLKKQIAKSEETKKKKHIEEATTLIATRSKLERDYDEDKVEVLFYTSPETKRKVLAKRPSNKEMITIMMLSAQASKYEGSAEPDDLMKMVDIYKELSEIAANLSVDKELDREFWDEKISFSALQNFITELIDASQKGHTVSQDEMKNFR